MTAFAVVADGEAHEPAARALALELGLPLADGVLATNLLLRVGADGLSLVAADGGPGLRCELAGGRTGYRRRHGGGRSQALARAVGLRAGARPRVLDATAGLGRDGYELAGLGCTVTLVERSPVIFALLRDGLARAALHDGPACARIELVRADAGARLAAIARGRCLPRPDVVYLDPMHPERTKSALVRKEMRLLRAAVGDDRDADALLAAALAASGGRVVVKRPRRAGPLADRAPDWTVAGRTTRYDVYRGLAADAG
ncbi:MAG: class I SAM-dependent methyltransferase [Gammaproteobacteria bacterium]|nr:class I SAM-dependent methyltransferase [Gammaproteobacteria bacterium]